MVYDITDMSGSIDSELCHITTVHEHIQSKIASNVSVVEPPCSEANPKPYLELIKNPANTQILPL